MTNGQAVGLGRNALQ